MSLVYLTHHNENVNDYEKVGKWFENPKPLKYVSKHKKAVKTQVNQPYITLAPDGRLLITDAGKHERRTMGSARAPLPHPKCFLRKNEGIKWRRLHDHICPKVPDLPPVPRVSELPPKIICPPKSELTKKETPEQARRCRRRNFIAININRIRQAETKRAIPRYIDTPHGDRHELINSGLIPQHICGRNFAKVPCYLNAHKKLLTKLRAACKTEMETIQQCKQFMHDQGVRKMTLEERVAILEGLKANYMEQSKYFQTLSLYTDTPTKKLRKGRLEKDLEQLELDIKFIEDNQIIYVSDY